VKYCYHGGQQLSIGAEKFCPNCGQNLTNQKAGDKRDIAIHDTKGDVFGTEVSGSGNVIGKELYTVHGNVLNLNISGGSVSKETIERLEKMVASPMPLKTETLTHSSENNMIKETISKQQISNVLNKVNQIKNESGKQITEIRAGDLQISTNDLLLKDIILRGNENFEKREFFEAIRYYDTAIKKYPSDLSAWNNKGFALSNLGRYQEAIKYYDKAIAMDPNNTTIWYNKGFALSNLGRYQEAIKSFDKAIAIDPNNQAAWNDKGNALSSIGRFQEAISYYDEAIDIDPNYDFAWNNLGFALSNLGKYQQAIDCYDKALKLYPNYPQALGNKRQALDNLKKRVGSDSND
jgi:tetratricopeptide (TPR) repeat protein